MLGISFSTGYGGEMEVRRLRLLRELSVRGTIAATAQACSLTPSAVSQQLSLLEKEARAQLLIRDGRRVVLTRAGWVLVRHTEKIVADLEAAKAEVASLDGEVRGTVRLSAFPTAASTFVPPVLATCQREYPDLRILLSNLEPADAVSAVKSGEVDLALVFEYSLLPRIADRSVELIRVHEEPMFAVVPPDHRSGKRLLLADLAEHRWVAPENDLLHRQMLERACAVAGFEPRVDYTSDDYTVMMALIEAGLCVTLVPALAVEPLSANVRSLPVHDLELRRRVLLAIRAGSRRDPLINAFLTVLRQLPIGG